MNTNPPIETSLTSSPARLAANRANAQLSTGPVTREGKDRVARNGLQHGICSPAPVLEGVESLEDWSIYAAALRDSLVPCGAIEEVLVERMILLNWRLRRLHRYETELLSQIHREQADQTEETIVTLKEEGREAQAVRRSIRLPDDQPVDSDDAAAALERAFYAAGAGEAFEAYWERCPEGLEWTAKSLRDKIREVATAYGHEFPQLLIELEESAQESVASSKEEVTREQRKLAEHRLQNLVLDDEPLSKIMRYETHLTRLFQRDLHELQRLQAARTGERVNPPAAIDVDVSGGESTQRVEGE